ncbi:hypothetical protein AVEN_165864-1 [Araneus ventricosus]|uniref:Uncharacterized protein n=1 Tax=Araneus ventricosus TaxID=182803 RepID=A0A4Y2K7S8_ARAVE|nr:hypothetical protein AVEN_165864-1 [Araneus ventricosus]
MRSVINKNGLRCQEKTCKVHFPSLCGLFQQRLTFVCFSHSFIQISEITTKFHVAERCKKFRSFLNQYVPNRWIGRCGSNDTLFCPKPLRSSAITPCDFLAWK